VTPPHPPPWPLQAQLPPGITLADVQEAEVKKVNGAWGESMATLLTSAEWCCLGGLTPPPAAACRGRIRPALSGAATALLCGVLHLHLHLRRLSWVLAARQ
jgi:hypothetical protein